MKKPTITSEEVAAAIDEGFVEWQSHTLHNQFGLETDDVRNAVSLTSTGVCRTGGYGWSAPNKIKRRLSAAEILEGYKL